MTTRRESRIGNIVAFYCLRAVVDEVRAELQTGYIASPQNDVFIETHNYSFVQKTIPKVFVIMSAKVAIISAEKGLSLFSFFLPPSLLKSLPIFVINC